MRFETDVRESTLIGFVKGDVSGSGKILFAAPSPDGHMLVVTDTTPVHPISFRWPDQPADHGVMTGKDGQDRQILDALTGLVHEQTGELLTGEDAKALGRTGDEWKSIVVHVVDGLTADIGETVAIKVDADRRHRLNVAHTGAHLAAFALNRATKDYWSKAGASLDSLGVPDFDKEAITSALLSLEGSVDTYRVGKTLKKKGFELDRFLADLPAVVQAANETLRGWLAAPVAVSLTPTEATLDTRRIWQCTLDGMTAEMYCAGTHVGNLAEIADMHVSIETVESGIVMRTVTVAR